MTAHVAYEICCDFPGCHRARTDVGTATQVRRDARKHEGFRRLPGGMDLCGDHPEMTIAEALAEITRVAREGAMP